MKKFMPILLAFIVFALPFGGLKAFAYSGGLLGGKTFYPNDNSNFTNVSGGTNLITDGNTSTSIIIHGLSSYYFKFDIPASVDSVYASFGSSDIGIFDVKFYDSNKVLLGTENSLVNNSVKTLNRSLSNVSYVSISNESRNDGNFKELDVIGSAGVPDKIPPSNVTNLSATNINDNSFNVSWGAPSDTDLAGYKVYLNNSLIKTITDTSYSFTGLSPLTQYQVKITAFDTSGNENTGTTITVKTNDAPDVTPPSNVTNLVATPTHKSVSLSWTNPPESDFSKVLIYKDGVYQKAVTAAEGSSAFFDNLQTETVYTFKVTSVDFTGNESEGSSINVKTLPLPEVKNIKNLTADSKYDRVKLSWGLPDSEYFHHVKIYRKIIKEESFLDKLFGFASTTAYAADTTDGYSPMFETNGTFWTDLTVTPETKYEYKASSVNTDGRESQGVVVDTATPQEPKPEIKGGNFQTSPTGDYVVSWQQPTAGTMKILVGSDVYKTVPADQGSYTIPKSDMKYTKLGDPDVSMQPVGKFGTEGNKVKAPIQNLNIPFTVNDLVQSGNGLLLLVGPFLLLALAFLLVPKFRRIIVAAFRGKSGKNGKEPDIPKGRRTGEEKQPISKEQREKPLRTEKEKTEPRTARIKAEKEQRTERIEKQPRVIKESHFRARQQRTERETRSPREPKVARKLKRQPRLERETRQPREPRERRRG